MVPIYLQLLAKSIGPKIYSLDISCTGAVISSAQEGGHVVLLGLWGLRIAGTLFRPTFRSMSITRRQSIQASWHDMA
ncbi:hypothetical protein I7I53_10464 [Histoplasma capsulatum var. duboisii H88]|uniref:Uncharacterized protein n=1 Tax=Ajellomyces capsulatus (strain H88) TaxID=544711 RepID=A0A8A1LBW6_AJEC8|nr:hypothetical protein I7I53_10464 [Histoplasma capsulatum var. duboisii H88]